MPGSRSNRENYEPSASGERTMPRSSRYPAAKGLLTTLILAALLSVGRPRVSEAREFTHPLPAPAFTHSNPRDWINSAPLTLRMLRGKVILLDFWTFDCWNCYRSFPWLKSVEAQYGPQGLEVIGVHTPEFAHERVRADVIAKVHQFGLHHPIMIDNDYSYWHALGNHFWPTFYLIDRQGRVRARFIGETHIGDHRARAIERDIKELLKEGRPG